MKCCFTGLREQKLPWGKNQSDHRCILLKENIKIYVKKLIDNGYTNFISGMALGVDTYCAQIILQLKKSYAGISLERAIPCKQQSLYWNFEDKKIYNKILNKADKVTYIFENYNKMCNSLRNKYMVNNSDFVLAVWDGKTPGGTSTTIKYAQAQQKPIKIIDIAIL